MGRGASEQSTSGAQLRQRVERTHTRARADEARKKPTERELQKARKLWESSVKEGQIRAQMAIERELLIEQGKPVNKTSLRRMAIRRTDPGVEVRPGRQSGKDKIHSDPRVLGFMAEAMNSVSRAAGMQVDGKTFEPIYVKALRELGLRAHMPTDPGNKGADVFISQQLADGSFKEMTAQLKGTTQLETVKKTGDETFAIAHLRHIDEDLMANPIAAIRDVGKEVSKLDYITVFCSDTRPLKEARENGTEVPGTYECALRTIPAAHFEPFAKIVEPKEGPEHPDKDIYDGGEGDFRKVYWDRFPRDEAKPATGYSARLYEVDPETGEEERMMILNLNVKNKRVVITWVRQDVTDHHGTMTLRTRENAFNAEDDLESYCEEPLKPFESGALASQAWFGA